MLKPELVREARHARHQRVRKTVNGVAERPRLAVFRSLGHIYAQIIDDGRRHTLVAASSSEATAKPEVKSKSKTEAAKVVGKLIAQRALQKGIDKVVFDRGGYLYHGRVKALADAAREGGLKF